MGNIENRPNAGRRGAEQIGDSSATTVPKIWLDGGVLSCACPECGAPMSIRLWLMVADCWQCGTSIELSYEQEQEALRLLRRDEQRRQDQTAEAAQAIKPSALRPPAAKNISAAATATEKRTSVPPRERPHPNRYQKPFHPHGYKEMPAWLISMIFHMVLFMLLALWIVDKPAGSLEIFLSTSVSYQDLDGAEGPPDDAVQDAVEFDAAGAEEWDKVADEAESSGKNDVELKDPALDIPEISAALPDLSGAAFVSLPPAPIGRMFSGRDPELRAGLVQREGGTSFTEAAVTRGIKWIARHQNKNGSWSLHNFSKSAECRGRCTGESNLRSDTAATAMALLPILGAGQTHLQGDYQNEVFDGLKWLIDQQQSDGDLRGRGGGRMYAHGQAAIVLCEAYGLTGDPQLREPAQKALDFIVAAQHERGGWRYDPGQAGDTSVVGWQLMALRSGQMAKLHIPSPTFEMVDRYLDDAQTDSFGGRYAYMPGREATHVMSAEALLCRQYLGWPGDHPGIREGVEYLLENLPRRNNPNIYYWYYATQVMHHAGGSPWDRWNDKIRVTLTAMQEKRGHEAGSWTPRGAFANQGGRLYMTSLAVCTLEVYYRHLPLYREEVLEDLFAQTNPSAD